MARSDLTATRLREVLHYDPVTGDFHRLHGKRAGIKIVIRGPATEYAKMCVAGKRYYAHRLAWLYVYGEWPRQFIDHIDCDRRNNAISNLRDVSQASNNQNRRTPSRNSKSGILGVCWATHAKMWLAQVGLQGRNHKIGYFHDKEEAHQAYLETKRKLHDGFAH